MRSAPTDEQVHSNLIAGFRNSMLASQIEPANAPINTTPFEGFVLDSDQRIRVGITLKAALHASRHARVRNAQLSHIPKLIFDKLVPQTSFDVIPVFDMPFFDKLQSQPHGARNGIRLTGFRANRVRY